jgi:hypothetical protein
MTPDLDYQRIYDCPGPAPHRRDHRPAGQAGVRHRRRLEPHGRAATWRFYQRLGTAMGINGIPGTAAEFEAEFDAYEKEQFAFDPAAAALYGATRVLMAERVPAALRPLRRVVTTVADTLLEPPVRTVPIGRSRPGSARR